MTDREKVIKAFEICDNNEDGIVCKNCPYKEDKWNGAWEDETGKTCFQTLHADVLELLKEQENDLRIMFNRCQATAKLLTSGSACNGCIKREKCERLTKYEP